MKNKKIIKESPEVIENDALRFIEFENNLKNKIGLLMLKNQNNLNVLKIFNFDGKRIEQTRMTFKKNELNPFDYHRDFYICDDKIVAIVYFVKENNNFKIKFIWNKSDFKGLAKYCLFNVYGVNNYVFLSDNQFTKQGKRFLYKLLLELKQQGYKIGILDEDTGECIENIDILTKYNEYWGPEKYNTVFTITKL